MKLPQNGSISTENIGQSPVLKTVDDVTARTTYVEDTFINKTAISPSNYAQEYGSIVSYSDGSRQIVTYFTRGPDSENKKTSDADVSVSRNSLHTSYTKICDFEITLTGGYQGDYDQGNSESKAIGTAITYPGFKPVVSDIFYMEIGDGNIGEFIVTGSKRLGIRQGASHQISYVLNQIVSRESNAKNHASVTKTLNFDKSTYLGDGTTLFEDEEYVQLQTLRRLRPTMIRYYYSQFYNESYGSLFSSDGIYDPYLIEFVNSKISLLDSGKRAAQLYPSIPNYERTIWSRLTEPYTTSLHNLRSQYDHVKGDSSRYDSVITTLINKPFVFIKSDDDAKYGRRVILLDTHEEYVLSNNFYTDNTEDLTYLERAIKETIFRREVSEIADVIDVLLNNFSNISKEEAFYAIPLYIHIIDVAINTLTNTKRF